MPGKFLKLDVIRQIFIGIDLALIVLLNAYKSHNIVKIVSPSLIIPYQPVEQLVEDGYTVYSRIGDITLASWRKAKYEFTLALNGHGIYEGTKFGLFMETEVLALGSSSLSEGIRYLYDHSSPHPFLETWVNDSFHKTLLTIGKKPTHFKYDDGDQFVESFKGIILERQETELTQYISSCNKSALIVPLYFANQIARDLQIKGLHMDVGTKAIF